MIMMTVAKIIYYSGFAVNFVIRQYYTRYKWYDGVVKKYKSIGDYVILAFLTLGSSLPLIYLLTSWLDFADFYPHKVIGILMITLGTLLYIPTIWYMLRSHADLGKNWAPVTVIVKDQVLVTDGIYKSVRHPMYTSHLLWGFAQALLLWNWIVGPTFLFAMILLIIFRIPREERMLIDQFGEDYIKYKDKTKKLIPYIY